MPPEENIAAIIDIGSAETKVLLANPFSPSAIVGLACGKTEGMKKGEIIDLPKLNASVHKVIHEAEKGVRDGEIHGSYACLAISSVAVSGEQITGYTSVKGATRKVSEEDMEAACEDAYSNTLPSEHALVHRIKQGYVLDGEACENPKEKTCKTSLSYKMWRVCARRDYLTNLIQIPNGLSLAVKRLFLASIASDEALSDSESYEKKNRLVIDIGAGTTDYVLFQNGIICKTGVIPVGGEHITNDISVVLHTSTKIAEKLKVSYACAIVLPNDHNETLTSVDNNAFGSDTYSRFVINYVVNLRVVELFELVRDELPTPVTIEIVKLTGGTSQLNKIGEVAAKIFNTKVVTDAPNCVFPDMPEKYARECRNPKYSTVLGTFSLLSKGLLSKKTTNPRGKGASGMLSKIISIFSQK